MTRTIPLSKGYESIVDDEDFDALSKFKWYATVRRHTVYAVTSRHVGGKCHTLCMHRYLLGAKKGEFVDHADRDGLNNRRSNIRICTHSLNMANRYYPGNFRGTFRSHGCKSYCARITVDGRDINLGSFPDRVAAALAYDEAARKHFGPFARLNFPDIARAE